MKDKILSFIFVSMGLFNWEAKRVFANRSYWLFAAVFLALTQSLVFFFAGWLEGNRADMTALYNYIPWMLVILIPALTMQGWSEERKLETSFLRISLPVSYFLQTIFAIRALWLMLVVTILGLSSLWVTANWLGSPDNWLAFSAWLGILLLAGYFLSVAYFAASFTASPLFAFILGFGALVLCSFLSSPIVGGYASYFSFLTYFNEFTSGFISWGSLIFFAFFIATFFIFTWSFSFKRHRKTSFAVGLALLLIGALGGKQLLYYGIDVTKDQRNSIPSGSEGVFKNLNSDVNVTLFKSNDFGDHQNYFDNLLPRIESRINRFTAVSDGRLTYSKLNFDTFSEGEDKAIEEGLIGIRTDLSGSEAYFGILLESFDKKTSIPIITDDIITFDQDFLRGVLEIGRDEKPKMAVITHLTILGFDYQGQRIPRPKVIDELSENFDIFPIYSGARFAELEPDLVLIADAKEMPNDLAFELQRFLLLGGKALFLQDPAPADYSGLPPASDQNTTTEELLQNIGVNIDLKKVVSDINIAELVNVPQNDTFRTLALPTWLKVPLPNQPLAQSIKGIDGSILLSNSGAIDLTPTEGIDFSPLIVSTNSAGLVANENLDDVSKLSDAKLEAVGNKVLAVNVKGSINKAIAIDVAVNASSDGDEISEGERLLNEHIAENISKSVNDFEIIVFADADFIKDEYWLSAQRTLAGEEIFQAFRNNGLVFLNLIEGLQEEFRIISNLSTPRLSSPSFTRLENIHLLAETQYRSEEIQLLDKIQELTGKIQDQDTSSEIDRETFRQELINTRAKLRNIRYQLNSKINDTKSIVRIINVFVVPLLFLLFGWFICWFWNRRSSKESNILGI